MSRPLNSVISVLEDFVRGSLELCGYLSLRDEREEVKGALRHSIIEHR